MSRPLTFVAAVELLRRTPLYDSRTERLIAAVETDGRIEPTDELCEAMEQYARDSDAAGLEKALAPLFRDYGLLPSPEETLIKVLAEVRAERRRQYDKWGERDHPSFPDDHDQTLAEINEDFAKKVVEVKAGDNTLTFRDIFFEEMCEAMASGSDEALRGELIQVAAVAVAWVEAIDRRPRGETP